MASLPESGSSLRARYWSVSRERFVPAVVVGAAPDGSVQLDVHSHADRSRVFPRSPRRRGGARQGSGLSVSPLSA